MFLGKDVLKICRKFTGEHPCRSASSIKLQSNFIEIALRHGFSPVNLLRIFRTSFLKKTSGWLLLFLISSIVFPKTALFIRLKKSISKSFFTPALNLVFMSMFLTTVFDQIELLYCFLVSIHGLVLVLELLCQQHSFLCHVCYKQAY